ncbi:MAG TPA: hypothetical protein VHP33_24405 [Polyangiaceae bacterium]|nr:hypothetical protein [Polyangiaceae bacterium]
MKRLVSIGAALAFGLLASNALAQAPKADNQATAAAKEPEAAAKDTEAAFTGDPFGDDLGSGDGAKAGVLNLRALLQARYRHTFATPSKNTRPGYALREDVLVRNCDGFALQRFFVRLGADPIAELGFKAILDFAKLDNPENVLKQAYATVRPLPKRVEVALGILKLPFSSMELDPIARFELSELGTTDDLIKNLGFAGRDVGAELMVAPLPKPKLLRLTLGAFGGHAKDEQASPLGAIGARLESKPLKGLRLGIDAVGMPNSQDYKRPFETSGKDVLPNPPDPLYPREVRWAAGKAYSADATFERHHLMLRGEGLLGDRVDVNERYGARSFWAFWALAAYDLHAGWLRLTPVVRAEWLDTDRDHDVGRRRELSAGIGVPYKKRMRFLVDVRRSSVQRGTPVLDSPKPLPATPYFDRSSTRVTLQFQAAL